MLHIYQCFIFIFSSYIPSADLKQLHNRNEQIQTSPRDPKLQLYSGFPDLQVPPTNPAAAGGPPGPKSPRVEGK